MKKRKILEISLQHKEEVYKARDFNIENNYEYILIDTNRLIDYDNLAYLLRIGYELNIYADNVELRHKSYKREIEEIKESE
jgi:hypothetical protein